MRLLVGRYLIYINSDHIEAACGLRTRRIILCIRIKDQRKNRKAIGYDSLWKIYLEVLFRGVKHMDTIIAFFSGALIALLPICLQRRWQLNSLKKALKIELEDISERIKADNRELTPQSSIRDYTYLKKSLKIMRFSFNTPVIDSCYSKIDLMDKETISSVVKVKTLLERVNREIIACNERINDTSDVMSAVEVIRDRFVELIPLIGDTLVRLK